MNFLPSGVETLLNANLLFISQWALCEAGSSLWTGQHLLLPPFILFTRHSAWHIVGAGDSINTYEALSTVPGAWYHTGSTKYR